MRGESRPWGAFGVFYESEKTWTKLIYIYPGESLSLQYHHNRSERWVALDPGVRARIRNETLDLSPGTCYTVPKETLHQLSNPTDKTVRVLEVAIGAVDENDIVRVSDKYGRHK